MPEFDRKPATIRRGALIRPPADEAFRLVRDWARFGLEAEAVINLLFGAVQVLGEGRGPEAERSRILGASTLRAARTGLFALQDILLEKKTNNEWPDSASVEAGTAGLWPTDRRILRLWIDGRIAAGAKPVSLRTTLSCLRALETYLTDMRDLLGLPSNEMAPPLLLREWDTAIAAQAKSVGAKQRQAFPIRFEDLQRLRTRILEEQIPEAQSAWDDQLADRNHILLTKHRASQREVLARNASLRELGLPTEPLPSLTRIHPPSPAVARLLLRLAILGLGFFGSLRTSEALALRVGDFYQVRRGEQFLTRCVIRRSKRDQHGEEQPEFTVDPVTVEALQRLWSLLGIQADLSVGAPIEDAAAADTPPALPYFKSVWTGQGKRVESLYVEATRPISETRYTEEIKQACRDDQGLRSRVPEISGYSLRVGSGVTLAENVDRDGRPISVDQLMDQMRHKTPTMSMRYIKQARKHEIGEAFFGEAFVQSLSQ